jgi:ferritin-like protein
MTEKRKDRMLQWFKSDHLSVELQIIVNPFRELAEDIVATLPENPERTVALRKLLEAKDCAVRAKLYQEPE